MSADAVKGSITLDSRGYCIFCLKKCAEWEDVEMLEQKRRFCVLLARFLGINYKFLSHELKSEAIRNDDYMNKSFSSAPQIDIISTCSSCQNVVDKFCEFYHQMKSFEMKVECQVRQLKNALALSTRDTNRQQSFMQQFQENGNDDGLKKVQAFRSKLSKKCSQKLQTSCPRIFLQSQTRSSTKTTESVPEEKLPPLQIKVEKELFESKSNNSATEYSNNSNSNNTGIYNEPSEAIESQLSEGIKIESLEEEVPEEIFTPLVQFMEHNDQMTNFEPQMGEQNFIRDILPETLPPVANPAINVPSNPIHNENTIWRTHQMPAFCFNESIQSPYYCPTYIPAHSTNIPISTAMNTMCPHPNCQPDQSYHASEYSTPFLASSGMIPHNSQPNYDTNNDIYRNQTATWNSLSASSGFSCNPPLYPPQISNAVSNHNSTYYGQPYAAPMASTREGYYYTDMGQYGEFEKQMTSSSSNSIAPSNVVVSPSSNPQISANPNNTNMNYKNKKVVSGKKQEVGKERPYPCEVCNEYYRTKAHLRRHRKTFKHIQQQFNLQQSLTAVTEPCRM